MRKQGEKKLADRLTRESMASSASRKGFKNTERDSVHEDMKRASFQDLYKAFDIGVGSKEKLARVQQFFKKGKLKQSKASR